MKQFYKGLARIFSIRLKASFTLEAAVIVPLCMALFVTAVFLGFYMHDHLTVKSAGGVIALNNAEAVKAEETPFVPAADDPGNADVIAAKEAGFSVSKESDAITVEGNASFPLPLFLIRQFLGGEAERISTVILVSHLDARAEILKYKAVAEGAATAGINNAKGEKKNK